ncbi:MAG: hypothetical protein HUK15_09930 [Bacteroidales bacterium]|nr:hypothetical protein [Bacteroidales bacterium]
MKLLKVQTNPRLFWQRYPFDKTTISTLLFKVLPLFMLAFFAVVLFGKSLNILEDYGFLSVLLQTIIVSILFYATFLLIGFAQFGLCNLYGATSKTQAYIFSISALLPFLLVYALLEIFPSLIFFWLLVVYSLYVMYFGALHFLKISQDKILLFIVITVIINTLGLTIAQTINSFILNLF